MRRDPDVFELAEAFVHLTQEGAALRTPVGADFWSGEADCFSEGRLVSVVSSEDDWTTEEMHPSGEELILCLSGRLVVIDFAADGGAPQRALSLDPLEAFLVPRGAWHTADVPQPGRALFVTPGAGSQTRPRRPASAS